MTGKNRISKAERTRRALLALIDTVDSTGGLDKKGHPVEAPGWADLGEVYVDACHILGVKITQAGTAFDDAPSVKAREKRASPRVQKARVRRARLSAQ